MWLLEHWIISGYIVLVTLSGGLVLYTLNSKAGQSVGDGWGEGVAFFLMGIIAISMWSIVSFVYWFLTK